MRSVPQGSSDADVNLRRPDWATTCITGISRHIKVGGSRKHGGPLEVRADGGRMHVEHQAEHVLPDVVNRKSLGETAQYTSWLHPVQRATYSLA